MKPIIFLLIILLMINVDLSAQVNSGAVQYATASTAMEMSDMTGGNKQMVKVASGIVTPSTTNGYSIDISGLGFTNVMGYSIIPIKSTTTATSVPKIAVKSESTSAIVVNVIEGNSSTVNILGSLVLLGTSEQFASTSGLTLRVTVWGL